MKKAILFLSSLGILLSFALPTSAQLIGGIADNQDFKSEFTQTFDGTAEGENLEDTLPAQIGRIVQLFVSFAGVLMLVMVVYAGLLWMTAGGNTDKVESAKKLMKNAIIGLVIVLLAFVIVTFINGLIINAGFGTNR